MLHHRNNNSRAGEWNEASQVLLRMRAAGLGPTLHTYNTRMGACQRSGHYSDALVLLEEMFAANVQPDAVTYTSLLWTVGKAPAHTHPRPGPRQWEVRNSALPTCV
jgi:pentatricopeptide repeat protein